MRMKDLAALIAVSLVSTPVMAAAPSAAALSVAPTQRAGAATGDASALVGTTAWILAAIAFGLIVWGIIELTDDSDSP